MSDVRSAPLHYLGNREQRTFELLSALTRGKRFKGFYDPFCGSGAFAYAAAQLQLAAHYHLNDSYVPLIKLLQSMVQHPQRVLANYAHHDIHLRQQRDARARVGYYHRIRDEFHQPGFESHLLFLNNFADYHLPLIDKGHYCSELQAGAIETRSSVEPLGEQLYAFARQLRGKVSFSATGFEQALSSTTRDDLVVFDPPYPDLPDERPIYHRLHDRDTLHTKLIDTLGQLHRRKTSFVLFYGTWGMDAQFFLTQDVYRGQHLVWLSPSHSSLFGEYLEHCYVSPALVLSEEMLARLPVTTYASIKDKSASQVMAYLRLRAAVSEVGGGQSPLGVSSDAAAVLSKTTPKPSIAFAGREMVISPRQRDVLVFLKQGLGAKETALLLGLSVRTVEFYMEQLRQKTGCRTKLQLISQLQLISHTGAGAC